MCLWGELWFGRGYSSQCLSLAMEGGLSPVADLVTVK